MPPFSEIFGDADRNRRVIVPGLAEYYTAPTRENARALLVSLKIPVPYAALVQSAAAAASRRKTSPAPPSEQRNDSLFELESSSSGGGHSRSAKSRAGPSAPTIPYVAPFQMIEPPALFEAHRLLDLLHDLLEIGVSDTLQERLYRKAKISPALTAELTKFVSEAYDNPKAKAKARINHRLTDIAEALAGLSSPRSHALAFKPNHALVATDMDLYLHSAVSRWYDKPSLEIVLDGIFRVVTLPRADRVGVEFNEGVNDSDVAKSLTLCAYLQLAITDWETAIPAVSLITPRKGRAQHTPQIQTKEIMFLTGDFQTLDVAEADHFMRKWISYIKTETEYLSHLPPSAIGTRHISVADIPPLADTPFANFSVNSSGLRVKLPDRQNVTSSAMRRAIRQGTFVPYGRKRGELVNSVQPNPSLNKKFISIADRYSSKFFTSNPKEWMHAVFRRYRDQNDSTPETEAFIETLAAVNAFRDAIRAEVALARGAVYITIDALALVYYQARADRLAKAKHSEGLMIHPNGSANLAITYYTPMSPTTRQSRAAPRSAPSRSLPASRSAGI